MLGKSSTLTSASSKSQIIRYITNGLIQRAVSGCYSNTLLITGLLATPNEITLWAAIERQDLKTSHEEADLIMVQQAYRKILHRQVDIVSIICNNTDVLVLLTYFYWKLDLSSTVLMEGASTVLDPTLYDWRKDELNKELVPIGLPDSIAAAPDEVLNMVKCGCSISNPCKTRRYQCVSARATCSLMCNCHGDAGICQNEVTKGQTKEEDNGRDGGKSYVYCTGCSYMMPLCCLF